MSAVRDLFMKMGFDGSQAKSGLSDLDKKAKKVADRFVDIGKTMSTYVTAPLVALGGLGLRTFVQLEDAWAGVEKVTAGTSEELTNLREKMHELVTVGGVPLPITEMYGIAQAAGRLGITTDNVMGFSETVAMLGTVTNMTAEQAATDMAQFATVMQMPQERFDQLGATLVGLGNNMAATESDIMRMGARLTGAGSAIGLAESEVLGFSAAFSALGINAEAGGTAFTNIMLAMQDATFGCGEKLEVFARTAGKSVCDFADLFENDAASAIVYFIEGIGHLQDAGENTNALFEELGFSGVNVTDLLRRGANAGSTLRDAINLANTSWDENIALSEAAGKRYNTTAAQIQVFRNNLSLLSNMVGEELVGRFSGLLNVGIRFFEWLGNLNPRTRSLIVNLGMVAAAIGPVLLFVGKLIKAFLAIKPALKIIGAGFKLLWGLSKKLVIGFGKLIVKLALGTAAILKKAGALAVKAGAFVAASVKMGLYAIGLGIVKIKTAIMTAATIAKTAAIWLKNIAFYASPIGWIVLGIGALITIGVLLWRNWDNIREKMGMLWEAFKNIFGNIKDFVMGIVGRIADFFSERFPAAFDFVASKLGIMHDMFVGIFEGIKQIFRGVIDFVVGIFTGDWSRAWEGVKSVFEGIFSTLGSILKAPINMIINLINGVIGGINRISISVPNWVPGLGGRELGFNIPKIPMLAKGTDSHVGGPAIVGEKGPELVMLPKGTSVTPTDKTLSILASIGKAKSKGASTTTDDKTMSKLASLGKAKPKDRVSKLSEKATASGRGKTPPIENKVVVNIQEIKVGGDGEISLAKIQELKKFVQEVFQDAWEAAWYALCLKYPNLTEA